ncbi:hypothetical protein TNCV_747861 [Trichonephila clavipes]|nr:hypothetical protein TNCV_747861 [Trichonephila clavipes]
MAFNARTDSDVDSTVFQTAASSEPIRPSCFKGPSDSFMLISRGINSRVFSMTPCWYWIFYHICRQMRQGHQYENPDHIYFGCNIIICEVLAGASVAWGSHIIDTADTTVATPLPPKFDM